MSSRPARADIEAILPLTPMQESLLFGTLAAGDPAADPAFLHLRCTLRGELDEDVIRRAWDHVIARHAALRTSVHWENADRPLQVVSRTATLPWRSEDLRAIDEDAQRTRIEELLAYDRARGLDLRAAPAMRVLLIRTRDDVWQLVWTCHHVLLDGWSGALVLGEVADTYDALTEGAAPHLPAARPYRDFVGWVKSRETVEAEAFWKGALHGVEDPTPLPFAHGAPAPRHAPRHQSIPFELDVETTASLLACARRHRCTPGTLLHAAWALLLAGSAGRERVCFGTTLSGRATPVPGILSMVGVFSNVLPLAVAVNGAERLSAFLSRVQETLAGLHARAHDSPADIQAWSGVSGRQRLFDSMMVFENFPADVLRERRQLRWEDIRGGITSGQPLVLVIAPGERLSLALLHDREVVDGAAAQRIVDMLRTLLGQIAAHPEATVGALLPGSAVPRAVHPSATEAGAGVPPATPTELRLWKVWEQALGTREFGVEDDLFDLGAHSLLIARVLREIEAQLGVRVPVATLFRTPTVRALAAAIDLQRAESTPDPPSLLVPLAHGDGVRPPLFFLHGLAGDVIVSYNLVRYLDPGQRVWGVEATGRAATEPRIEDMAATYARAIRAAHPRGPYHLAGYCFGGTLAYAAARHLADAGEDVALLAVIDADPRMPGWPRNTRFMHALWDLQMTPRGRRARVLRHKVGRALTMIADAVRHEGQPSANGEEQRAAEADPAHMAAYARYVPRPYAGEVTVLLAADDPPALRRWRRARWVELAKGGVTVHELPGTHFTLMTEPHVRALARRLQQCIDAAGRRGG